MLVLIWNVIEGRGVDDPFSRMILLVIEGRAVDDPFSRMVVLALPGSSVLLGWRLQGRRRLIKHGYHRSLACPRKLGTVHGLACSMPSC